MFGKIIVDNRENPDVYYDGTSMGMGKIKFTCSKCQNSVEEITLELLRQTNDLSKQEVSEMNRFFSVEKEPVCGHSSDVGYIVCDHCKQKFAIYCSGAEIQMCRYQAALLCVAEYDK
ncbi:hypothetical protein [Vibrio salinus]|uniref:hypothetical protein n=1 Tax=Vibrio salinus TaxID=2899784 RepID=UPI001E5C413F|nr:hypothetical protein [Vibrio salinus]MCE0492624.1 hypothetical protein [Vibrio salinus]